MPHLAAFPKCYLDDIIVHKSMTVFDWIDQASQLGVDGLEMYAPFFESQESEIPGESERAVRCRPPGHPHAVLFP